MRIAMLPSSYLPESLGGTEVYVHHLALSLKARGHAVAVVIHAAGPATSAPDGYEVVRLPEHPPRRRADLYRHSRGDEPAGFGEFLDCWRPDVVHFHAYTLGAGRDHSRAAKQRGLPYIVTYHTPTFSCPRGTLLHWGAEVCDGVIRPGRCAACVLHSRGLSRPLARLLALSPWPWAWMPEGPWAPRLALPSLLADGSLGWHEFMCGAAHIVACADWCRDVLLANGIPAERVSIHRQALPGEDRTRRLRLPLSQRRPLRLGFFGRITAVKGPDLFLEGLRGLRQRGLEVVGELVGPIAESDRPWAEELLAGAAGLAAHLGVKHGKAMTAWLDTLDLVVIPSRWLETGPLTLLEAWDREIPVVGSDLGGIRQFMYAAGLEHLLFEPDNPGALVEAVLRAAAWPGSASPEVHIGGMAELGRRMEALYRAAF